MSITPFRFLALSALAIGLSACNNERHVTDLPPGHYEKTTKTTNADGTDVKQNKSTNVTVDEYGNKRAVVTSKTTTDPKGLFNKRTDTSTQVIEER